MKPLYSFFGGLLCLLLTFQDHNLQAQDNCGVSKVHGQGYTTTITSVTDLGNNCYTIVLTVSRENCTGCKKMTRYSVEADPFTYSNIFAQSLSGNLLNASINYGPHLGGDPFQGFRIDNVNGMNNGQAVGFTLTYTLAGGLQDQHILAKAANHVMVVSFTTADFQSVLDCQTVTTPQDIFPYYPPLEGGKSFDIIGSELTSLYLNYSESGNYISDDIFQIIGNNVLISIQTQQGQFQNALNLLTTPAYGLTSQVGNANNNIITGLFPILNLLSLNELPELLVSVGPVYSALGNVGIVTSQGDISVRSYLARSGFGVNGQGVKIGVLSDSYNTILGNPAADDALKGDLPGANNPAYPTPVDVILDYPYGTKSDEGRAMLQIIHDVAPGAELAFRTGFLGAPDFAAGIIALQEAGCDIIVDDITYINEPFFRDGVVAQAVDSVASLGVTYFSAAGNFGTRSWQNTFSPSPAPAGIEGEAHNFATGTGGNDIYQSISLFQGNYTVVLQWDDGTPGNITNSDFDIYLSEENGNTLFGFNRVNTGGAPLEVLPFTVASETAQSNFLIVRASGSGPALLKYIVFRGDVTINEFGTPNASTIVGQANAEGAIAVGAVLFSNTPEFGVNPPTVASFSSRGSTPVNGVLRQKPDITAPNGVNTTVDLGGVNIDGDAFPNFFGTSAAAPHAAAVAALILDGREKFYGETLTPSMIKGIIQNSAIDMYTPGYDPLSGAGFIQADAALQTFANAAPFITGIYYDSTLVPGLDSILITIYGELLTEGSQIWFNGAPLDQQGTLQGDTAIVSIIPPFNELYPIIQVYNPPLAGTNGLDGGLSNPIYFTTKETILVTIDSKSKKYGEKMPAFTASYSYENLDGSSTVLDSAGLSQVELDRIYSIGLTTIANTLSNVGLWAIEPNTADPLNPQSNTVAADSLDISLLQRFNFVFNKGLLTINPLDLNIAPLDTFFVYNDSLSGFSFKYRFNNDSLGSVQISEADSLAILASLQNSHNEALVNKVAVVRGTALVNELGEPLINSAALENISFMISQALFQSRGTALVNGELIDPGAFANALAPSTTASTVKVRGTALVNGLKLVRGTALVNDIDSTGNITNTTALVNADALVNSSANINTATITEESNSEAIVILGDDDIAILSGDSVGNVIIRSVSLITDNRVGTHYSVPGALLSNNFIVTYTAGLVVVLPDTVEIMVDAASLSQIYDGDQKPVVVSTLPENLNIVITYNGDSIPPTNVGTYDVLVFVNDSNYVGSATATLIISPDTAEVLIDTASLEQEYDGNPKTVIVSTLPEGLETVILYNGSGTPPVNVGTYEVEVTIADDNYVGSTNGIMSIVPGTAEIIVDTASLTQFFDGFAKSVQATTIPEGLNLEITYNGSTEQPVNIGTYEVELTIVDANYVGSANAILTISTDAFEIFFDAASLDQVYDGFAKAVIVTTEPAGVEFTVLYDGSPIPPVNAGLYSVEVIISDAILTGSAFATLIVNQAVATISTGIYVINQNQPLPVFEASFEGLLNGDDETVVTSTSFVVSPNYNGQAGIYNIAASALAQNYTFVSVNGTLYVNPAGIGTQAVITKFECYEELDKPDLNGFGYVAYFSYINNNSTGVYIPIGSDNQIYGSENSNVNQPELFLPSGGSFAVPFDGGPLKWRVRSNNQFGFKTTYFAYLWSNDCSKSFDHVESDTNSENDKHEILVYPNPSAGKVCIQFNGESTSTGNIEVYDNFGRKCVVHSVQTSNEIVELDLSGFSSGMYTIRIMRDNEVQVFKVLKN